MQAETFLSSLTSGQIQYLIIPLGCDQALNSLGLSRSATHRVAHFLFGYTYMNFRRHKTIKCRLSLSSLVRLSKLARSTVKSALDNLEQAGLIQRACDERGTEYSTEKLVELFAQFAKPTGAPASSTSSSRKQSEPDSAKAKLEACMTSSETQKPKTESRERPAGSSKELDDSVKQQLDHIDAEMRKCNDEIIRLVGTGSGSLRKALNLKGAEKERFDQINQEIERLEQQRSQLLLKFTKNERQRIGPCLVGNIISSAKNNYPPSPKEQLRPKRVTHKQAQAILKQLKEMSITNPTETLGEILWSLNFGWLAQRQWRKEGCIAWALKAIKKGQWTTPAGFQPHQAQKLLEVAIAQGGLVVA